METSQLNVTVDHNTILEDKPWARDLLKRLQTKLAETVMGWVEVMINLSDNQEDIDTWVRTFEDTCEDTYSELIVGIEAYQGRVALKIEKHLEEINALCTILQISMPPLGHEARGLHQEQAYLQNLITEYKEMIKTRTDALDVLRNREMDLCQCLGMTPRVMNDNHLPGAEEVEQLQEYINNLEEERFHRMEEYCNTKQKIMDLVNNLKYEPRSKFESDIIENDNFKITSDNMEQLRTFYRNLSEENNKVKEEINHIWGKIEHLWNILDIDLMKRVSFKQNYPDCSYSTLAVLKQEQGRCEEIKRANIKIFIEKLRNDLKQLWEKCHLTEEDGQNKFQFWQSDCYTEDLLSLYEMEVEKWNRFYQENKELLQLIEKHKQYWTKMIELEQKSADPNRFNNRGGQLLKEEKERNALGKKIPLLEEKLIKLSENFNLRNAEMMKTFGITIPEYLDNVHADRENARKQKVSARKQNSHIALTPMKSVMSLFSSASASRLVPTKLATPGHTPKTVKISKKASTDVNKKIKVIPKITLSTVAVSKRRSTERKGRLEKRRSAHKKRKQALDSTSSEYREFEDQLSERKGCRSTLNPLDDSDKTEVLQPKRLKPCTPSGSRTQIANNFRTPTTPASKSNYKLIF